MAHNALAKKAEDAMVSFGSAMEAKRDEAIQAIYGASAQLSANTKSSLSMVTSAIGAGFSGYVMGNTLFGKGTESISPELTITGTKGGVSTLGSLKQLGY